MKRFLLSVSSFLALIVPLLLASSPTTTVIVVDAWAPPTATTTMARSSSSLASLMSNTARSRRPGRTSTTTALNMASVEEKTKETQKKVDVEETTEKYGLEAGLFQSLTQNKEDGGESAKSLLKRYGIAYLATSIPLAIVSFAICYVLVDQGIDMANLLSKVGIEASGYGEKAGTFALAYAAHKAASPIRFPPTVLLTPVVAKLIGKEPVEAAADEE